MPSGEVKTNYLVIAYPKSHNDLTLILFKEWAIFDGSTFMIQKSISRLENIDE